jgi:hypothetical protein
MQSTVAVTASAKSELLLVEQDPLACPWSGLKNQCGHRQKQYGMLLKLFEDRAA